MVMIRFRDVDGEAYPEKETGLVVVRLPLRVCEVPQDSGAAVAVPLGLSVNLKMTADESRAFAKALLLCVAELDFGHRQGPET